MIKIEEMKKAVGEKCRIIYLDGRVREGIVEEYHYEEGEDEEPFILYEPLLAAVQSELERIEILG